MNAAFEIIICSRQILLQEKCDGRIEFKDVQFWYPHAPGIKILKGISFTVTPGQMIALVSFTG